jgi:hypothetical protein
MLILFFIVIVLKMVHTVGQTKIIITKAPFESSKLFFLHYNPTGPILF